MDRTLRAALLAGFIAFAVIAGLGIFLGFESGASVIAGVIAGALGSLLLVGAARRADRFHGPGGPPPPVEPGFPGPPDPPEDDQRGDRGSEGDQSPGPDAGSDR